MKTNHVDWMEVVMTNEIIEEIIKVLPLFIDLKGEQLFSPILDKNKNINFQLYAGYKDGKLVCVRHLFDSKYDINECDIDLYLYELREKKLERILQND
jgi:hypothetical protein